MFDYQSAVTVSAIALVAAKTSTLHAFADCVTLSEMSKMDNAVILADLAKAMLLNNGTMGTVDNYKSRLKAALMVEHRKTFVVDVALSFEENCVKVRPQFVAYWGEINAIKKSGPGEKAESVKAESVKAETVTAEIVAIDANIPLLPNVEKLMLSIMTNMDLFEDADLATLANVIRVEVEKRDGTKAKALRELAPAPAPAKAVKAEKKAEKKAA